MLLENANNSLIDKERLNRSILSGAGWNMFGLIFTKGFSYITVLILARILLPENFGVVAMAVVFTGLFSTIGEIGLTGAIIQRKEKLLNRIHLDTAFWASAVFNFLLLVLFVGLVAPFASWFYDLEILHAIVAVSALKMSISTFAVVPKAILLRSLNFRSLVIGESSAALISGIVAIILALYGFGVWSLVLQSLIQSIVLCAYLWLKLKWIPRKRFSKAALRDLLGFGLYDALSRTSNYLTKKIDYLLVGKLLGPESLGIYSVAFMITDILRSQIMSVLNKTMFPIYGKLQDNKEQIRFYYLTVVRYNTLAVSPIMLVFLCFAGEIIILFLGEAWMEAQFPLQAMAIACIIHSIGGTSDSVLKGMGKVRLLFITYLLKTALITIPAFTIGIYFYGLNGAAAAIILHKAVSRFLYQYYLQKLIDIREIDLIKAITPTIISATAGLSLLTLTSNANVPNKILDLAISSTGIILPFFLSLLYLRRFDSTKTKS